MDVETGIYEMNSQQQQKWMFKYEKEGKFYLGVVKVESLDGKITGKLFPVFDYKGKQIVTIEGYKKEMLQ